jgi:hypothetical protein
MSKASKYCVLAALVLASFAFVREVQVSLGDIAHAIHLMSRPY